MAVPKQKREGSIEGNMGKTDYKSVLRILEQYHSMPLLQLRSLIDIDDTRLGEIIDELEREGIVDITDRGNDIDEIVTLSYATAASASSTA